MKKIEISNKQISFVDDEVLEFFEKVVTAHGTGGKIPCSSKFIGRKVYVVVRK